MTPIITRYTFAVEVRGVVREHVHVEAAEHEQDPESTPWENRVLRSGRWVIYTEGVEESGVGDGNAGLWSTAIRNGFVTWDRDETTMLQFEEAMAEARVAAVWIAAKWEQWLAEEEADEAT